MNEVMQEILLVMLSYIGVIAVSFGIMNWLLGGKLMPFIKVKTSMGKKILVHIRTMTHDYYRVGKIVEGHLVVKDQNKETRRISVLNPRSIYRASGVNNIVIDDEYNVVFNREFNSEHGHDAVKTESLYVRALMRPQLNKKMENIVLAMLAVIIIIGLATAYFGYQNNEILKLLEVIGSQAQVIS